MFAVELHVQKSFHQYLLENNVFQFSFELFVYIQATFLRTSFQIKSAFSCAGEDGV